VVAPAIDLRVSGGRSSISSRKTGVASIFVTPSLTDTKASPGGSIRAPLGADNHVSRFQVSVRHSSPPMAADGPSTIKERVGIRTA